MILDTRRILWRSRGFDWGFVFLITPEIPFQTGWYDTFKAMADKAHITPGSTPNSSGGVLYLGKEKYPYVFTAFLNSELNDWTGQAIPEYFVYFPDILSSEVKIPNNWGLDILKSFSELRHDTFRQKQDKVIESQFISLLKAKKAILAHGKLVPVRLENEIHRARSRHPLGTKEKSGSPRRRAILIGVIILATAVVIAVILHFVGLR